MLIQKQTSGDVWLVENGQISSSIQEDCTINCSPRRAGLEIVDASGRLFFIELVRVQETQINPAAAVAFTGSLQDFYTLMVTSFFNEFHSGAGGAITSDDVANLSTVTGATVTDALNNLAAGGGLENNIVSTAVNYSILTSDYIVYATASNIGIRLPTIGTNIGQFYRIYANNNSINVLCDDPSGDRIIGQTSIQLKKWDSATFRAIYTNQWLISD